MTIQVFDSPAGIPLHSDFTVEVKEENDQRWRPVPVYAVEVANANVTSNEFNRHTIALASFDFDGPIKVQVTYTGPVQSAEIRPRSLSIETQLNDNTIAFSLRTPKDVMLELNGTKWTALHLLSNGIDANAPTHDTDDIWYFGPGINQGSAYQHVTDGVNLLVPSGKTVYLAGGAFITCRLNFINNSNSAVRGHGFILGPEGGYVHREHGGAIHMSGASKITVEGVTSLGANGFSLSAGECRNVHIDRYRSFSSAGNGDGIDIFCSRDIVIENCFLRNSDDTIALYSHRWDWHEDSQNILIQHCVLLPDIAHAINMGTHGDPSKPETTRNVTIRDIDILDHEENQLWYQGCIAINAADMNLFHDIHIEDVRVERITRGQLINLRVMQNAMWTTAPGRGIRDVRIKNLSLDLRDAKIVNPSMILGYNAARRIENVTFENLRINGALVHEQMEKPRWYMTADMVPLFMNEHVEGVKFLP
ncbi:pectin lyase-like protein [Aspergillus steynii IBT 23096]|uniref:Pectin lyase-like protein n=1 Tax=Aspergillus steynii IBT 23096 TaxID=1392250 RepID=A0A2I2FX08_9EURO|nr:pectin lyase-like protein [Aspergillus steynii IBT 23096]PLB45179.1 pectin lyase-like protein [Aspergillus steynii IBT 23096]